MALEIKICGITNESNLKEVCSLNPDYVGFIFYSKSKRLVSNIGAIEKMEGCHAKRVGVFVNASEQEIIAKVHDFDLDIIQLHGDETPEFCTKINEIKPIFKAFQINNNFNYNKLKDYLSSTYKFLFDTASITYGGSGQQFDWSLLKDYKLNKPFILSGGITKNDADKIRSIQHPMLAGIDLNSKFEINPGVKDISKLDSFIKQIRA